MFSEIPYVGEDLSDLCSMAWQEASSTSSPLGTSTTGPATCDDEKHLERWEDKHVRLLIASYSKLKTLGKGKTTKKELFSKIATEFNSVSEEKVTADQCLRKWSKLEAKQKEIEDHNKKTGNNKKSWKYQDDMAECMGSSPKISPVFTFDTGVSSASSSTSQSTNQDDVSPTDESGDEGAAPKQKRKVTRKRKSKSSAAEMLEFLHSYSEKREKVEAEKLELFKAMKEEKKEFFSQFLEVLKNK